jgi:hypothetical protein
MNASFARSLDRYQTAMVAMSAPGLLQPKPLQPPVATAPLAQSLTLRELFALSRIRQEVINAR